MFNVLIKDILKQIAAHAIYAHAIQEDIYYYLALFKRKVGLENFKLRY